MIRLVALLLSLVAISALAAGPPPAPPGVVLGGVTQLAASMTTANVALPATAATFPFVTILNDSTVTAFFRPGDAVVTASVTDFPILANSCVIGVYVGNAARIAAITATGSTLLRIIQANGPLQMSCPVSS